MAATDGTPLRSARSARKVADPNLHTDEVENAAFTLHLDPDAAEGEAMVMGPDGKYLATNIVTQAEHAHPILSATHTDTDPDTLVRGDLLVAIGATPKLTRYPWTAPAAGVMRYLGGANGEVEPTYKDASANPGAAESILASAPTTGLLTLTQLATTVNLQTLNAEVTVANKNKYLPYLQDASGVYLRKLSYRWTGSAWEAAAAYGFGHWALVNNSGIYSNGVGYGALSDNTGTQSNGLGFFALAGNTGANCSGFGHAALQYNSGATSNGFGSFALQYNTGTRSSGFGYAALQNNTGGYSAGLGFFALQYNSGVYGTGFGYAALQNNTGAYSAGLGYLALIYNNWPGATGIGAQDTNYFLDNPATAQAFTDAEISANTITFGGAHGFGVTGARVNLRFNTTAGTPPTGLVNNVVYQFTITSPTVISKTSIGTNASGDFEGKLTNSVDIHNSVAIGHNANADKAYQAVLGGTGIVETLLRGNVLVNTTTVGAQLAVDQSSATGALPVLLLDQGDDDEPMIEFTGTVGTGNVIEAVGAKTLTVTHYLKVEITGVGVRYIPLGTIA